VKTKSSSLIVIVLLLSLVLNVFLISFIFGRVLEETGQTKTRYKQAIEGLHQASDQIIPMVNKDENNKLTMLHVAINRLYNSEMKLVSIQQQMKLRGLDIQNLIDSITHLIDKSNEYYNENITVQQVEELIDMTNSILSQIPLEYSVDELKDALKYFEIVN